MAKDTVVSPTTVTPPPAVEEKSKPKLGPNGLKMVKDRTHPDGEREQSFPREPKPGSYEEMLKDKWKEQKRVKCAQKKCYYPLDLLKEESNGFQPQEVKTEEGVGFRALCSWDPTHERPEGGEQYILLETLKDNAEEGK